MNQQVKACKVCNEVKPFNSEHFVRRNEIKSKLRPYCRECKNKKRKEEYKKRCSFEGNTTKENFIKRSIERYGSKFDYSGVVYINSKTKIKLNCNKCGFTFFQIPNRHFLQHTECIECKKREYDRTFLSRCSKVHENKYIYLSNFKSRLEKIKIYCPTHGVFFQVAANHLKKGGCPKCNSSKGELKVESLLKQSKIEFQTEKIFDTCINPKTNSKLRFDFFLPKLNVLIEYDGEQHFKEVPGWKPLKDNQYRDKVKNKWALDNYLHLIRISYKENIVEKLKKCNII